MFTNPYNDDKRLLELLEGWQSGNFSRADEQELQALADSDEFRREAVQGFWSLPEDDHAAHLASLRERLRKRTGGGRRVALPQIFAAAAAVALLISAAIWLIPSKEVGVPMAQKEVSIPTENQPIASNFPEEKIADEEFRPNGSPQLDRLGKTAERKQSSPMMDSGPFATSSEAEAMSTSPQLSRDEQGTDKIVAAKPSISESGNSAAKSEQDDLGLAPGSAARRTEPAKEAPADLKKSDKAAPTPSKPKDYAKQRAKVSANASQPAGGWSNFQDYLRRNARLTEAARQQNVSGTVRLRFRLDENNQPTDFQTLRSLGHGCDEEAIRLLKAYSWQRGTDPKLTVDVPFVR
ncbi:MAG: energy transducer TonB [Saprospiraceae bacterium]